MRYTLNCAVVILLVIIGNIACSASPSGTVVYITNVKSGLVCLYKFEAGVGYLDDAHVCFETEDIYITGQSECVFDGRAEPCTWYGYEFDYDNKSSSPVILTCKYSSHEDTVVGNPDGIWGEDISSYEITLEPGKNHFSNPQYTVYRTGLGENPRRRVTVCGIEGQQAFVSEFNIHLPSAP